MTADGAVGHYLREVTGKKWYNLDVEAETGCGVVPIQYEEKNTIHALQWTIGLEWFLRVSDPWKVALSTDHPNGAPFLAYPQLIALLMSRNLRDEVFARLPERVRSRSALGELDREYSLSEIAVITRAGPARILGMTAKGHLGVGADADLSLFQPDDDLRKMFAFPRYVIKSGTVLIDDGQPIGHGDGQIMNIAPQYDEAVVPSIRSHFERESSIQFRNFSVAAIDEEGS